MKALDAATYIAALHDHATATAGREIRPRASPRGQLAMNTDMAATISRPANQSVTILVMTTLMRTAPTPLINRPLALIENTSIAVSTPPMVMSNKPMRTMV